MRFQLIAASTIAVIALAAPLATYSRAEDAHHPEKAAKAKASTATKATKTKQKKSIPAAKSDKGKQSEIVRGAWTWRV